MQIVMAVSGTRGDVQPAVVLGAELALRGHEVVMAVPPNLVSFARGAGLETVPFGYDTREHMNSDLVRHGVSQGSVADRARAVARLWNFGWDQMVRELTDVMDSVRPDVLLTGITTEQIALPLAQRFGAGLVAVHHAPVRSNSRYSPIPGAESLPRVVTPLAWSVVDTALWAATCHRENVLRRGLGLGTVSTPLPRRMAEYGAIEIQAYDPAFCPDLQRDWAQTRPFAGFLDMPSALRATADPGTVTAELETWLAAGPPPVYVGFGSMPVKDPAAMVAAVRQACDRSGVRALVSVGWNDAGDFSDDAGSTDDGGHLLVGGSLDHEAVFPRCRAVIHHGGAGSTAAGIRAGKPTVVCSVASDQPFWGRRIVEQSCGATLPASSVTADTMDRALRVALSPDAQEAARALSDAMIAPEVAAARAADLVESATRRTEAQSGAST
ncbi:hypothetical protein ASG56_00970 [Rhodococcus sp. Leaf7]|uniref:glycosyltransferase n=1 Tax=unclassified Rhodococcus (in: high G+C Gram-positive bacteria) TaxID=192944 RepID=UPI0006FBB9E7|nr:MULTISPECIES: nucleotide disphospho-sugar-binding domain-containing protein [unclassified Rhodococcus (in: high G+C Gram-positive bacteria)]KQU06308.1 hypothetical protein ASG56_00970 [Rhodococcus sp. Leaf7]KQU41825.1 hypothetical protein ASG64_00970 [Rhodococcus sp. Leaf247]